MDDEPHELPIIHLFESIIVHNQSIVNILGIMDDIDILDEKLWDVLKNLFFFDEQLVMNKLKRFWNIHFVTVITNQIL